MFVVANSIKMHLVDYALSLASESVEGSSLPLEGVDNVHGGDGLPLGVLSVGDSVPDDVLQEDLENATGLLVDEARDTLDSSTTGQSPNGGLGDALDVVPEHLPVPLGAALAQSLASFTSSSHCSTMHKSAFTAIFIRF